MTPAKLTLLWFLLFCLSVPPPAALLLAINCVALTGVWQPQPAPVVVGYGSYEFE